jgi:hypothetical protein
MTTEICILCSEPANTKDVDHGNRIYVACTNGTCGHYEISKRAVRDIADNQARKEALREMVSRANDNDQVLEIFIASDGALQASGIKRG